MKFQDIESDLKMMEAKLLDLARNICWNKISNNCEYIIDEIPKDFVITYLKTPKKEPSNTLSFVHVVSKIKDLYSDLYDVNLYVYKAEKNKTIIQVQYYRKHSMVLEESMLHCKVSHPPYLINKKEKFDVNWEFHGIRHKWKMFLLQFTVNRLRKRLLTPK